MQAVSPLPQSPLSKHLTQALAARCSLGSIQCLALRGGLAEDAPRLRPGGGALQTSGAVAFRGEEGGADGVVGLWQVRWGGGFGINFK